MKKERGFKLMNEGKLKAVHDDDLMQLLDSLGCLNDIMEERCTCKFCENKMTLENIAAVFPMDGEIHFCCNEDKCYKNMVEAGVKK